MRWLHSIGPYTPLSMLLWSPGCYKHSFPSGFQLGLADRRYQQGPGEWDGGQWDCSHPDSLPTGPTLVGFIPPPTVIFPAKWLSLYGHMVL